MKTLLQLLLAAALLNAVARSAAAAWDYYQLKDAAQQTVIFGFGASTADLEARIVRRAADLGIPLGPGAVTVTRDGPRTAARASYTQAIELFPRFEYPWAFAFEVDGPGLWEALYRDGRPVSYSYLDHDLPLWAAQTAYAARPWAFEMPSAGRPLSWQILLSLRRRVRELESKS